MEAGPWAIPGPTERVQQVLYSFTVNRVNPIPSSPNDSPWLADSGLFNLPKLCLSWLPAPSQGTAFPIETALSALTCAQFYSLFFSFIVWFPLLRCHLAFSAPILCFLWFHYFTEPLSFAHFVTLCLFLRLLVCFQPSIGGTYFSMLVSQPFQTWEVGLDLLVRSVIEQRGAQLQICSVEFIVQFCLHHWESLFQLKVPFLGQYLLRLDS